MPQQVRQACAHHDPPPPVLTTQWTDAEMKQLKQLVNKYGRGDWQAKAKQLGTGRMSASTGSARRNEASLKEEGGMK